MFMYVFFNSSPHHRDLHSFPTRRSSDLGPFGDDAGEVLWQVVDGLVATAILQPDDLGDQPASGSRSRQGDRKSTRLNSSHQIISYAVFCLKKKNKFHSATNKLQKHFFQG